MTDDISTVAIILQAKLAPLASIEASEHVASIDFLSEPHTPFLY